VKSLLKPPRLQPGQTIGLCCPASAPPDPQAIDRGIATIENLGFKPRLAPRARRRLGFLAGSDRDRSSDLMRLFLDRKVDAIFCIRGGYGVTRILHLLDYKAIRQHRKILVGYSDITALHCALEKHAGLISFHGPMLNSELSRPDVPAFTTQSLWRVLMQAEPAGSIRSGLTPEQTSAKTIRTGVAEGRLVGGNLSLLCALAGTPWMPDFRGRILFLEDLEEAPYRVDRMLTHLLSAGLLQQVAGVAVGVMRNCLDLKRSEFTEFRQTVDDVLKERLRPLGVPVVSGLPFGHAHLNATLPVGARARLDGRKGDLEITEAAVI
jgi:muramoyltetrapeptide carboxypeptidase